MINMKPTNLITIILLGIIFLQTGCQKNNTDPDRFLTDEMKSQNPYKLNDKLYFMSDSGQEFVYEVIMRHNQIYEYSHAQAAPLHWTEVDQTSINSLDTSHASGFWMEMRAENKPPRFTISFYPSVGNRMTAYFDLPLSGYSPEYVDSVYVNEKWHYHVFIAEKAKSENKPYKYYYTVKLGIIKIDYSDDSYWELVKIE